MPANSYIGNVSFELERHVCRFTPFYFLVDNEKIIFYTIEELKWDILILRWRGIGNDLK